MGNFEQKIFWLFWKFIIFLKSIIFIEKFDKISKKVLKKLYKRLFTQLPILFDRFGANRVQSQPAFFFGTEEVLKNSIFFKFEPTNVQVEIKFFLKNL